VLNKVFLDATSTIMVGEFIIDLEFAISINGVGRFPFAGTQVIFGDPYSYFFVESNGVIVIKGGL
jgi:hypothetical protein